MMKWILDNIETIISIVSTIISIILSGLISLWITAKYFNKGNRVNLQVTVIYPVVKILEESCTISGYNRLEGLSKEYCVRYMKKRELKLFMELISAYEKMCYAYRASSDEYEQFDVHNHDRILRHIEEQQKTDSKVKEFKNAKTKFMSTKIVKSIYGIQKTINNNSL